ncbi:MAG: flagellar hook-length control protein FliK, partial [Helicobacteraceae bacterium]|nr:flagellar hook-length control protein FliK [Helicobacteraceae bacterium]
QIVAARDNLGRRFEVRTQTARTAARYFASRLNEAIESYKPPITRVSIEMNPKELGKIEVTLIERGDSLIVSTRGEARTIALLIAHSAEFRGALAQNGHDRVDLRYYDNQDNRGDQNGKDRQDKERKRRDQEQSEQDSGIEIAYIN